MTAPAPPHIAAAIALSEALEPGELRRLADAAADGPRLVAGAGGLAAQGMRAGGPWDLLVEVLDAAARIAAGRLGSGRAAGDG